MSEYKLNSDSHCVVCKTLIKIRRDSTIRWYYADKLANPKYNKMVGLCCSKCFNEDFDRYKRPRSSIKPRIPTDPDQRKLF